jgi:hypothetical protein
MKRKLISGEESEERNTIRGALLCEITDNGHKKVQVLEILDDQSEESEHSENTIDDFIDLGDDEDDNEDDDEEDSDASPRKYSGIIDLDAEEDDDDEDDDEDGEQEEEGECIVIDDLSGDDGSVSVRSCASSVSAAASAGSVAAIVAAFAPRTDKLVRSILGRAVNPYRAVITDPSRRLVLGIDPGFVNLGVAWLDPFTGESLLQVIDMTVEYGVKYKFESERLMAMVEKVVAGMQPQLLKCSYAFIEDQIVPTGQRAVLEICVMFEQIIRLRYPNIGVYRIHPKKLRDYFGTSGRGGHRASKLRSIQVFKKLVAANHYDAVIARFTKKRQKAGSEVHPDGIEAMLLCWYGFENLAIIKALRNPPATRVENSTSGHLMMPVRILGEKFKPPGDTDKFQEHAIKRARRERIVREKKKKTAKKTAKPKKGGKKAKAKPSSSSAAAKKSKKKK